MKFRLNIRLSLMEDNNMKKVLAIMSVLALFSSMTTLSSEAVSIEKERGRISVNTSSNMEVSPDIA